MQAVEKYLQFMEINRENTAPLIVTFWTDLEVEDMMTNETKYIVTMSMARNLLKQGIISEEDYVKINTIFIQKYEPKIGTLLAEINLNKSPHRVNM